MVAAGPFEFEEALCPCSGPLGDLLTASSTTWAKAGWPFAGGRLLIKLEDGELAGAAVWLKKLELAEMLNIGSK